MMIYDFFFQDMSSAQLMTLLLSAVLIGINKTGMPGIGTLPVVMLALMFPTKLSTGLQLMMLCAADLMAVSYYRRGANWKLVLRLLPCALCGMGIGSLTLHLIDDRLLRTAIGVIILFLALLNWIRNRYISQEKIPDHAAFVFLVGLTAGFTTQVANAAGPLSSCHASSKRGIYGDMRMVFHDSELDQTPALCGGRADYRVGLPRGSGHAAVSAVGGGSGNSVHPESAAEAF